MVDAYKQEIMEKFVILNNNYNPPMYVTSIAVSSSRFDKHCVHSEGRVVDFYSKDSTYEVLSISQAVDHHHFSKVVDNLKKTITNAKREYDSATETLKEIEENLVL